MKTSIKTMLAPVFLSAALLLSGRGNSPAAEANTNQPQATQKPTLSAFGQKSGQIKTIPDLFRTVLTNADYICIEDIHAFDHAHRLLTDTNIMRTLGEFDAAINLEGFNSEQVEVINAFVDGKLSQEAAVAYIEFLIQPVSGNAAGGGGHFPSLEKTFPDIAVQAGQHKIHTQAINYNEGLFTADEYATLYAPGLGRARYIIEKLPAKQKEKPGTSIHELLEECITEFENANADKFEKAAEIPKSAQARKMEMGEKLYLSTLESLGFSKEDLSKGRVKIPETAEEKEKFTRKLREIYNYNTSYYTASGRIQFMGSRRFAPDSIDFITDEAMRHTDIKLRETQFRERFTSDPKVAARVRTGKTGKALVLYGRSHFTDTQNDIDATLGEARSVTLRLYHDQKSYDSMSRRADGDLTFMQRTWNANTNDSPDFTLELSTGILTAQDGTTVKLDIPRNLIGERAEPVRRRAIEPAPQKPASVIVEPGFIIN